MPNCQFVVAGMQRSGTTLMSNRLCEVMRLPYLHEPFNPRYGLSSAQAASLADRVDPHFSRDEILGLSWQRPQRRWLSRAAMVSKIIAVRDLDFFIKDPFWYFFHTTVKVSTPKFFVFKPVDAFLASNLSRGFTFRPLIRETQKEGPLHEAANTLGDVALVLRAYAFLAERALSDRETIFILHSRDSLDHAIQFLPAERPHWRRLGALTRHLNGWGRGMMRTGRTYNSETAVRSATVQIPKDARAQYEHASALEERMLQKSEQSP